MAKMMMIGNVLNYVTGNIWQKRKRQLNEHSSGKRNAKLLLFIRIQKVIIQCTVLVIVLVLPVVHLVQVVRSTVLCGANESVNDA